jgi:GDP-4-dehydro-6-deoxy-D-mannose reductase
MTERVLITGAAGFVGRHLARHLNEQGLIVHGLDRPSVPPPSDLCIAWHPCDITQAAQVAAVVGQLRPDYVFHLAALIRSESLTDLFTINVLGTQNVLDALVAARSEAHVLVAGSSAEYGLVRPDELPVREDHPLRPLSPYGVSKIAQSLLAAQYVYRHNLPVIRTRTFNLTGPGEPDTLFCSALSRQVAEIEMGLRPPALQVGNLASSRDFTDVRDAVRAYWLIIQHGQAGEVYNVCSGVSVLIREVLDTLLREVGTKIEVQQDARQYRNGDVPIQRGDVAHLRSVIAWSPTIPLRESLVDLTNYWRDQLLKNA